MSVSENMCMGGNVMANDSLSVKGLKQNDKSYLDVKALTCVKLLIKHRLLKVVA